MLTVCVKTCAYGTVIALEIREVHSMSLIMNIRTSVKTLLEGAITSDNLEFYWAIASVDNLANPNWRDFLGYNHLQQAICDNKY